MADYRFAHQLASTEFSPDFDGADFSDLFVRLTDFLLHFDLKRLEIPKFGLNFEYSTHPEQFEPGYPDLEPPYPLY